MRAVVQRVKQSSVIVDDEIVAEIGKGLLVLLGISKDDGINDKDNGVDRQASDDEKFTALALKVMKKT